jgi:hypothetical protein
VPEISSMHYGCQICSWKGYRATASGHYFAPMKLLVLLTAGAKTLKIFMKNMKERLAVFACNFKFCLPELAYTSLWEVSR